MLRSRWKAVLKGERGSATAEFAMLLPAVAVLLGVIGVAAQVGIASVRAQEAASTAARIAITNSDTDARAAALEVAGDEATVTIARNGPWITVRVTEPAPLGLFGYGEAVAHAQD